MKAILDPLVFWLPPDSQITQAHTLEVLQSIDFVVSVSRRGVQIATTKAVWQRINMELVKRLSLYVESRDLFPRIQALRNILTFVEPPVCLGQTWGVKSLFSFANFPDSNFWMTDIASLATYWADDAQEFVLLTRLLEGRNLVRHSSGYCVISEKTHWKVHIQSGTTIKNYGIACISSLRNLDVEWTTRYDDRLPDTAPGHGLRFVPPDDWDSQLTKVVRTIRAKPAWVDAGGNGWTDTSTPGIAHHWDVFLNEKTLEDKFKDEHVNITCWGTADRGRLPGAVHH